MSSATETAGDGLAALRSLGLSETGRLRSTGIDGHRARLTAGLIDAAGLERYAADLRTLAEITAQRAAPIPIDFWDTRSEEMTKAGIDEYAMVHRLSRSALRPYIELLDRCYALLQRRQRDELTAVAAALGILKETAAYVCAGHSTEMTDTLPRPGRDQRAITLWQQILTGTHRRVPYMHRDAYTHGIWGRFNVVEIWRYAIGDDADTNAVWGLTGFHQRFIGDPKNINQIEHMAISALAQRVLRLPLFLLDLLEDAECLAGWASRAEGRADKTLSHAVARDLLRQFDPADPGPACERMERRLQQG